MPIIDNKVVTPITDVQALANRPALGTGTTVKAAMDAGAERVRQKHDALVDSLISITNGDSGADNIGTTPIAGVGDGTTNTVMKILIALKALIQNVVLGQIPDRTLTYSKIALGTITDAELSNVAGQIKDTVTTHLAESVSQEITVTRDISLTGVQTITGLTGGKVPKRIDVVIASSDGTLKYSRGDWEYNGNTQNSVAIYKTAAAAIVSAISNSRVGSAYMNESNVNDALIQNITSTQFELNWGKTGSPTGTVYIHAIVHYH